MKMESRATKIVAGLRESKEPWQMTKAEYEAEHGEFKWGKKTTATKADSPHKSAVRTALNMGKQVPKEVLADYPDLEESKTNEAVPDYVEEIARDLLIDVIATELENDHPDLFKKVHGELTETVPALFDEYGLDLDDYLPIKQAEKLVAEVDKAWGGKATVAEMADQFEGSAGRLGLMAVGHGVSPDDDTDVAEWLTEKEVEMPHHLNYESPYSEGQDALEALYDVAFTFKFVVDKDERGEFACHVEDPTGKEVWSATTDDSEDGLFDPVEDGFMKNTTDTDGLEKYLKEMDVIPKDGKLTESKQDLMEVSQAVILAYELLHQGYKDTASVPVEVWRKLGFLGVPSPKLLAKMDKVMSEHEPASEAKQGFSPEQLEKLRQEYSKLDRVDPSSPAIKKLTAMLNGMDQDTLKQLADANIKFISKLALNRIKHPEEYPAEAKQTEAAEFRVAIVDQKEGAFKYGTFYSRPEAMKLVKEFPDKAATIDVTKTKQAKLALGFPAYHAGRIETGSGTEYYLFAKKVDYEKWRAWFDEVTGESRAGKVLRELGQIQEKVDLSQIDWGQLAINYPTIPVVAMEGGKVIKVKYLDSPLADQTVIVKLDEPAEEGEMLTLRWGKPKKDRFGQTIYPPVVSKE